MCRAIKYSFTTDSAGKRKSRVIYYPMETARIPVIDVNGKVELIQWGRRQGQLENSGLPITCWATLDTLPKWRALNARMVRVTCSQWMEKDEERVAHWFAMPRDTYLLGLEVERRHRKIVYLVVQPAYGVFAELGLERMPVFIDADRQQIPMRLSRTASELTEDEEDEDES